MPTPIYNIISSALLKERTYRQYTKAKDIDNAVASNANGRRDRRVLSVHVGVGNECGRIILYQSHPRIQRQERNEYRNPLWICHGSFSLFGADYSTSAFLILSTHLFTFLHTVPSR